MVSSHKTVVLLKEKNKIQQLKKDMDEQKRARESEEHRPLKMQKELETKLHLGRKTLKFPLKLNNVSFCAFD